MGIVFCFPNLKLQVRLLQFLQKRKCGYIMDTTVLSELWLLQILCSITDHGYNDLHISKKLEACCHGVSLDSTAKLNSRL